MLVYAEVQGKYWSAVSVEKQEQTEVAHEHDVETGTDFGPQSIIHLD